MRRFADIDAIDEDPVRSGLQLVCIASYDTGRPRMTVRPISFWLYVAAGVAMIIVSAIALPFIVSRSR
ncbi:multisubunit Na+/H+ antiporter MnhB subunit [Sphingomonas insulae]|uniref:Uncharacterized protein n=1 Tax=Sphingomonas insulae TaxID=424800 RepID=A0ABN1HYS2_9SPHN|nr:hypothetical protein [Sphingomonas insulae]NIJ29471.1 multisubunit Na+/H+ antiporter MnhB subunit [Sphingomonas insulae]